MRIALSNPFLPGTGPIVYFDGPDGIDDVCAADLAAAGTVAAVRTAAAFAMFNIGAGGSALLSGTGLCKIKNNQLKSKL